MSGRREKRPRTPKKSTEIASRLLALVLGRSAGAGQISELAGPNSIDVAWLFW